MQPGGLARGPLREPLPGRPNGDVAGHQQLRVPVAVALERAPVGVEVPAVELDDHAFVGEQGVDLKAEEVRVDERRRQVVLADERQEATLELRARGAGGVFDERLESEQCRAGARVAVEELLEVAEAQVLWRGGPR